MIPSESLILALAASHTWSLLQLGRKRLATQEKENRQARRRKVVSAPRPKAALLGRVTPIQTAAQPNARPSPIVSQVMTKVCATDEARGSTPPSVSASIPELSIDRLISKKPFLKAISTVRLIFANMSFLTRALDSCNYETYAKKGNARLCMDR